MKHHVTYTHIMSSIAVMLQRKGHINIVSFIMQTKDLICNILNCNSRFFKISSYNVISYSVFWNSQCLKKTSAAQLTIPDNGQGISQCRCACLWQDVATLSPTMAWVSVGVDVPVCGRM